MKCKIDFIKKNLAAFEVDKNSNLMQVLLDKDIPVASSCHGEGVCGKCKITILQGMQNLSAANDTEKFLQAQHQLKSDQRVGCQTEILGPITIDTGYW